MSDHNAAKIFDVIIIGAGPAGATTAFYLTKGTDTHQPKTVALLDKTSFPRDKYCGDAWCAPALDILEDMGVLQQLEKEGLYRDCTSGGFVSPSGESYISTGEGPPLASTRCYAIKRIICDERIARKAAEQGAELFENADYSQAKLEDDGFWTVTCKDGRAFRSKMLVAADGATSQVSRSLGVIHTAPEGVASRQYVKGGTHNFKSGGVLFYPDYVLPGYVALFLHYNGDIDIGVYIIPGGAASPNDILHICEHEVANDPFMQRVLGPKAEFLEKPRVASLRTGGVERSTDKQFLAVGDAAGQTDPITGEGIHTGMIGGKLAAQRIHEMATANDFSATACLIYHQQWMNAFGKDFPASAIGAKLTYKYPLLLDAANVVAQRKGDVFMSDFGATMTGVKPKSTFLRPGVAIPLGIEVFKQFFIQKFKRPFPTVRAAYQARGIEINPRATAFANACLINVNEELKIVNKKSDENDLYEQVFRYVSDNAEARRVTVVFGTEFGFSEEVAELLCEGLLECSEEENAQPLSLRYIDAEYYEIVDWSEIDTCLFVCATAGDGVAPQKAKAFFDFLADNKPDLSRMNTAILALGDSSYPHFCGAGVELEELLKSCDVKALQPIVKVDAEDMIIVNEFIDDMIDALCTKDYWQKRPSQINDELLPAKAEAFFSRRAGQPVKATAQRPHLAKLVEKRSLADTAAGGTETYHIVLDISQMPDKELAPLEWQPGDALGVLPANAPEEVAAVLKQLSCGADEMIELPRNKGSVLFKEALTHYCDIKNLKTDLLNCLRDNGTDDEELAHIERIQKNSKNFLAENELQDVLAYFPIVASNLNAQTLIDHLHVLSPRYYSIASSPQVDNKKIALTVATLRFKLHGNSRVGVASTYLNERLAIGSDVSVFVHANNDFRLPAIDSGHACIMIGAGTGVAPYRGFMQELAVRAQSANTNMLEQVGGKAHLLFFGCRHEQADFLYADEFSQWQAEGTLELHTAFSRDQKNKIYVQDRIREQAELVWQRMQRGDHIYVCGDATHMAGDVEKALLDILQQQGKQSTAEAQAYLNTMIDDGRYQKDVWA